MQHTESKIQIACVTWFHYQYPQLYYHFFSVPNGGKRTKSLVKTKFGYKTTSIEGGIMKAEGAKSGISDLILQVPNENHAFLNIEMKSPTGRQSENQKKVQQSIDAHKFGKYIICRSFDEFKKEIEDYLQSTKFGIVK